MKCAACEIEKRKMKVSNPPKHYCVKGNDDYVAPEYRINNGEREYQIFFNGSIKKTEKAELYLLTARKHVNGYKIKGGTELWVPDFAVIGLDKSIPGKHCIWVTSGFYEKLVFL